ncbi:HD-GYP domain-containing protein [Sphingomonas echinoides]|uniref:HD-GYP domain-containing protein n=1 Tax=Sphingomonas echinoides TaxID=59803 RepID=A0ABU4PMQ0_9SPHN|nr:HD-GYP domain-containing protein [Sphingomonas echinoides]MDX5983235.1 HD-GYP domain-containing protein [Sphingomonas echinoides]
MLRRITPDQIKIGMFIHAFDESWLENPFWLTRFLVKNANDLERIRKSAVPSVVIDERRGLPLKAASSGRATATVPTRPDLGSPPRSPLAQQQANSFAEETERATEMVRAATDEIKALFDAVHGGDIVNISAFSATVVDIISSIERNPRALIAFTRLKSRDVYTYVHSLSVSALLASFGRSLGMTEQEVFELGLAGLLHDIGKIFIPDAVLRKPESLTDEEFAVVRTHPERGHLLLCQDPTTPAVVLDVCRHHHERVDGTGYPFRLKGEAISRVARMAAICDVYDALTSNRVYKSAWTSQQAITKMHRWVGHFDPELLLSFMKVIGVYPAGLLIRLPSDRLAVTLLNGRRASRAKVRVFYCARTRTPLPLQDVFIEDNLSHDEILKEQDPLDWGIANWAVVAEQLMDGKVPRLPSKPLFS